MALPEPSSKGDGQKGKTNDQDDKDFDPTPEALIDEIDDERTLEEEEALDGNNGTTVQEELDALKKESEMPIEELLAYYQSMREAIQGTPASGEEDDDTNEEEDDEEEDEEEDESEITGSTPKRHKGDDGRPRRDDDDDVSKPRDANKAPDVNSDLQTTDSNAKDVQDQEKSVQDKEKQNNEASSEPNEPIQTTDAKLNQSATESNKEVAQCQEQSAQDEKKQATEAVTSTPNSTVQQTTVVSSNTTSTRSIDETMKSQERSSQERTRRTMTEFSLNEDDEAAGMFKTLLGYDLDDSDDLDEDYSYTDDENGDDERDWRRAIHVGPDFQADVPEGLTEYDDLPPYENEDKLVWKCTSNVSPEQILHYLKTASLLSKRTDISISSASVPKISYETICLYRERMHDIMTSSNHSTVAENQNSTTSDLPIEGSRDIYMSQSRKRARIDLELGQENAFDSISQPLLDVNNEQRYSNQEENSDSTSQDLKPELSTEEYFQDEEQLLFLLLQCNHNFDEAFRRRRLDPFKYYLHEPMSLWSQEECLGFEHGLRVYGKDFRQIRENKVPTRTHAEVVAFYYLWKKSERHDVYTNRYKLDRKRCLSHPGTTDYMDKFIEDNESAQNASSSSTPTLTESVHGASSSTPITNDGNSTSLLCKNSSSSAYTQVDHIAADDCMIPSIDTNNQTHLEHLSCSLLLNRSGSIGP